MDDVRCLQRSGRCDGCLAPPNRTVLPHPLVRLLLDHPTARSHDGGGYPASMCQRLVGGIDNGVDRLDGDITLDDEHVSFPHPAMRDDVHASRLRHSDLSDARGRFADQARFLKIAAAPMPPPMHIETIPYSTSRRFIS